MPVIEVEHLSKRYGETVAVADVSFAVERTEIFGILGPNGAGKTTTVESIAGLRTPDGGRLSVLGIDPVRDPQALRELVGVQLQEAALPEHLRVREALDLYASFYRDPVPAGELLDALGLGAVQASAFGDLSGGQRQRLSIALALVGRPEVAILDELTTGLDPSARRETWALIEDVRRRGVTVLLVTHSMEEAERLCDRLAIIAAGRVVALGAPGELTGGGEQTLRFRPSGPVELDALRALASVAGVQPSGADLVVSGAEGVLADVVDALAQAGVRAERLRVEQSSLEDVYLELTA